MSRAAVVLRDERCVALVRRVHQRHTYFTFPGGDVKAGEQPADAAVREARTGLGVRVVLGPRLLIEDFRAETSHYYSAVVVDGDLGSGTDEPVWMELEDLARYDVRPRALAAILTGG